MSGRKSSARPRANLSQHFLRSASLARRLVALSSISPNDLVVEAGPGRGTLTRAIAERSRKVLAVELDRDLTAHLRGIHWPHNNVEVIGRDFLDYSLPRAPYKFFSNIPFARTADIVRKLAFSSRQPDDAYLIVQSEAATRFLGQPFGPESSISLLIKAQFDASILAWLNPTDFEPPPAVNSVLLRLSRLEPPRVMPGELREFGQFVKGMMRAGNRPVASRLHRLVTSRQSRGLIDELNLPRGAPSAVSFEHWLTVFRLQKWNRP